MIDAPPARIVATEPSPNRPDGTVATIHCPHCDRVHTHGLRGKHPGPREYRAAHCASNVGYYITEADQ